MKDLNEKLRRLKQCVEKPVIMILGLGSVGTYLLDYLTSSREYFEIVVVGRDAAKMEKDVNIVRIGALIRQKNRSKILIEENVDFNHTDQLIEVISKYQPHFIVNTSRAYSGLKYGSISWNTVRAYGLWTPLAIKYVKNIMDACELAEAEAIVINSSYSDAVIPWLKSAGKRYPDFGSGNINHLIPRIKYAAAQMSKIEDYWNIDVMLATSHFHDVVISKEGQTEGVHQLLKIFYRGTELPLLQNAVFEKCKIVMPVNTKRNIMNASSNFEIIDTILDVVRGRKIGRFFSPGAFGEIGGYPVIVDGGKLDACIDESIFSLEDMRIANQKSIALDGVEDIKDGALIYTDILLEKSKKVFNIELPKRVAYEEIDEVAENIIQNIIVPQIL